MEEGTELEAPISQVRRWEAYLDRHKILLVRSLFLAKAEITQKVHKR